MTPAPAESTDRPRRKLWTMIVFIFAAQIGLIFWLAAPWAAGPSRPVAGPELFMLGDGIAPSSGAIDPTLLALPGPHGFSGGVWLRIPTLNYQLEEWQEPPRFLALQPQGLDGGLGQVVLADSRKPVEIPALREPQPEPTDLEFVPAQTTITLTGDLAGRALLSTLVTNPWPSTNLLSNTVVKIAVDARGQVYFPPELDKKSGSPAADAAALDQAARLTFRPLRRTESASPGLTWGRLIFHWQTVPLPATNAPAGGGQ